MEHGERVHAIESVWGERARACMRVLVPSVCAMEAAGCGDRHTVQVAAVDWNGAPPCACTEKRDGGKGHEGGEVGAVGAGAWRRGRGDGDGAAGGVAGGQRVGARLSNCGMGVGAQRSETVRLTAKQVGVHQGGLQCCYWGWKGVAVGRGGGAQGARATACASGLATGDGYLDTTRAAMVQACGTCEAQWAER